MRADYTEESMSRLPQRHDDGPTGIEPIYHLRADRPRAAAAKAVAALALLLSAHVPAALATPSIALDPHGVPLATCAACHGASGEGSSAGAIPRLAGQNASYIAHALSMFKEGTRASATMQSVARNLSDSDMRHLADYFSTQQPPLAPVGQPPNPAQVQAGQQLSQAGDGANLAACFSCHGAGGKGNGARFPSIAGQPATFITERLHEFQERAKNGAAKPGTMTAVAAQMTDAQIADAAAYLSTLSR